MVERRRHGLGAWRSWGVLPTDVAMETKHNLALQVGGAGSRVRRNFSSDHTSVRTLVLYLDAFRSLLRKNPEERGDH